MKYSKTLTSLSSVLVLPGLLRSWESLEEIKSAGFIKWWFPIPGCGPPVGGTPGVANPGAPKPNIPGPIPGGKPGWGPKGRPAGPWPVPWGSCWAWICCWRGMRHCKIL